ncbi:response regulator transcription factor [Desulfatiferula olefinivorans]
MKVLIADDHEIIREGLTRLIDRQEDMHVVGYAENGLDAVFKTRSLTPDIVILDTGMPVLSGLEAVPLVHEASPDTKIIIFSTNKNDEYVYRSFTLGAAGYVLKLSSSRDVLDSIRAVSRGERFVSPVIKTRIMGMLDKKKGDAFNLNRYDLLSYREQKVFRLIAEGFCPSEIATLCSTCETTIRAMEATICDKIGIHDMETLGRFAEHIGVIPSSGRHDMPQAVM